VEMAIDPAIAPGETIDRDAGKSGLRLLMDTQVSLEKVRIAVGNRVSALERMADDVTPDVTRTYIALHADLNGWEEKIEKLMADELDGYPVFEAWLGHVKGIGPALASQMLAMLMRPLPERGPSTWYKAAGLFPELIGQDGKILDLTSATPEEIEGATSPAAPGPGRARRAAVLPPAPALPVERRDVVRAQRRLLSTGLQPAQRASRRAARRRQQVAPDPDRSGRAVGHNQAVPGSPVGDVERSRADQRHAPGVRARRAQAPPLHRPAALGREGENLMRGTLYLKDTVSFGVGTFDHVEVLIPAPGADRTQAFRALANDLPFAPGKTLVVVAGEFAALTVEHQPERPKPTPENPFEGMNADALHERRKAIVAQNEEIGARFRSARNPDTAQVLVGLMASLAGDLAQIDEALAALEAQPGDAAASR
jgi:hypothetical protein